MNVKPPMLATPSVTLPQGPDWSYEIKFDGYRALAIISRGSVTIRSRRLNNLTHTYPTVVRALSALRVGSAILDGEIVAVDGSGRPSFQALQNTRTAAIVFYAFDLLELNGHDLTSLPLEARRRELAPLVKDSAVLFSESLAGTPAEIETAVRSLGLEGVVAKRRGSKYVGGTRTPHWIKVRFNRRQEFVVGGYRPIDGDFDALLVGYYQASKLLFAAKVRAGFTPAVRAELLQRLGARVARCPFDDVPRESRGRFSEGVSAEDMAGLRWVRPKVVVEIAFVEWTDSGLLRHPSFVALRTDKSPRDVRRE